MAEPAVTAAKYNPRYNDFSLRGKVVVVTEAQPDDALGVPEAMAAAGAELAVTGADPDKLAMTVDALHRPATMHAHSG